MRHLESELTDLMLGRLSPEKQREVEEHLKTCDTCATDVAWVNRFREAALKQGLRHIDADRIVQLAADRSVAGPVESEHLESCAACRQEMEWASGVGEEEEDEPLRRRRPWLVAAAAVLAISLIPVAWIWIQGENGRDLSALAVVEPLPVNILRDVPDPGSFEEHRSLGLEAYAEAAYGDAREHFTRALERSKDHAETLLYLGSVELLSDRPEEARELLHRCESLATDPLLRDEASWLAAAADLRLGRNEDAEARLRELAGKAGRRKGSAAALLQKMAAR